MDVNFGVHAVMLCFGKVRLNVKRHRDNLHCKRTEGFCNILHRKKAAEVFSGLESCSQIYCSYPLNCNVKKQEAICRHFHGHVLINQSWSEATKSMLFVRQQEQLHWGEQKGLLQQPRREKQPLNHLENRHSLRLQHGRVRTATIEQIETAKQPPLKQNHGFRQFKLGPRQNLQEPKKQVSDFSRRSLQEEALLKEPPLKQQKPKLHHQNPPPDLWIFADGLPSAPLINFLSLENSKRRFQFKKTGSNWCKAEQHCWFTHKTQDFRSAFRKTWTLPIDRRKICAGFESVKPPLQINRGGPAIRKQTWSSMKYLSTVFLILLQFVSYFVIGMNFTIDYRKNSEEALLRTLPRNISSAYCCGGRLNMYTVNDDSKNNSLLYEDTRSEVNRVNSGLPLEFSKSRIYYTQFAQGFVQKTSSRTRSKRSPIANSIGRQTESTNSKVNLQFTTETEEHNFNTKFELDLVEQAKNVSLLQVRDETPDAADFSSSQTDSAESRIQSLKKLETTKNQGNNVRLKSKHSQQRSLSLPMSDGAEENAKEFQRHLHSEQKRSSGTSLDENKKARSRKTSLLPRHKKHREDEHMHRLNVVQEIPTLDVGEYSFFLCLPH